MAAELNRTRILDLPDGWDESLPSFTASDGPVATRAISSNFVNHVAKKLNWLLGGSADLEPSTKTLMKEYPYLSKDNPAGRNIAWGIRELAMCGTATGMLLHGGVRPYAATFFVFTDYARPAIRLAALMELPVIYIMTHDSVGLGEDGPTHQPIEQLASLRAMPNLTVIRPADANETIQAWKAAIINTHGPSLLALSRQKLPILDQKGLSPATGLQRGAYILKKEAGEKPQVILLASGSEVGPALDAHTLLHEDGIDARVVSMPSWELFEKQDLAYRESVLPASVGARVSMEAGATLGWSKWVGDQGISLGIDRFGISAPYQEIYENFGLTAEKMKEAATQLNIEE